MSDRTGPWAAARPTTWALSAVLSTSTLLFTPAPAETQDAGGLSAACAAAGGEAGLCARTASAADFLGRSVAAFAAHGAISPDVQRTLGRRLPGGAPRVGLAARPAFGGIRHPGLGAAGGVEVDDVHLGAQGALQVGIFEGFQPYPPVGGVLAADLLAGMGWLWLPTSQGYGGGVGAGSLGARVGLLRESFTAPGVALTYAHVWVGATEFGPTAEVRTEPTVQALRVALGKDVRGVGLHLAAGRDWVDNDVRVQVPGAGSFSDRFESAYTVIAAGASLNFVVLRAEAEMGWAFAPSGEPALVAGFDPTEGMPLGGISIRLIF